MEPLPGRRAPRPAIARCHFYLCYCFGIERAKKQDQGAASILIIGVTTAWSILAGFPETAYISALLVLAWGMYRFVTERERWTMARRAIAGVVLVYSSRPRCSLRSLTTCGNRTPSVSTMWGKISSLGSILRHSYAIRVWIVGNKSALPRAFSDLGHDRRLYNYPHPLDGCSGCDAQVGTSRFEICSLGLGSLGMGQDLRGSSALCALDECRFPS